MCLGFLSAREKLVRFIETKKTVDEEMRFAVHSLDMHFEKMEEENARLRDQVGNLVRKNHRLEKQLFDVRKKIQGLADSLGDETASQFAEELKKREETEQKVNPFHTDQLRALDRLRVFDTIRLRTIEEELTDRTFMEMTDRMFIQQLYRPRRNGLTALQVEHELERVQPEELHWQRRSEVLPVEVASMLGKSPNNMHELLAQKELTALNRGRENNRKNW